MRDGGQAGRSWSVQKKLRRGQNLVESLAQLPDVTPDALEAGSKPAPIDTDPRRSAHLLVSEFGDPDAHCTRAPSVIRGRRARKFSELGGGGCESASGVGYPHRGHMKNSSVSIADARA